MERKRKEKKTRKKRRRLGASEVMECDGKGEKRKEDRKKRR